MLCFIDCGTKNKHEHVGHSALEPLKEKECIHEAPPSHSDSLFWVHVHHTVSAGVIISSSSNRNLSQPQVRFCVRGQIHSDWSSLQPVRRVHKSDAFILKLTQHSLYFLVIIFFTLCSTFAGNLNVDLNVGTRCKCKCECISIPELFRMLCYYIKI